jgi:NTE family protein
MPGAAKRLTPIDGDKLEDIAGLCLSGGGYRAMLFHTGSIYRMNELGLMLKLSRISGVSGGSMTTGALAACWSELKFDGQGRATNLTQKFLKPVLAQANSSIDVAAAFAGILPFSSAADAAARSYDENFAKGLKLKDLPDTPVFVFNATSLMTGNAVRFRKSYIADFDIGQIENADVNLSAAVAASAAFPPVLSPSKAVFRGGKIKPGSEGPLARAPYSERAVLTDGGVYDNLGTETVWKRCRTIFVSNAGKPFAADDAPAENWLQQSLRVLDIAMNGSEDLRERILAHAYEIGARNGAMWGLSTGLMDINKRPKLLSAREYSAVREIPTRLTQFSKGDQALVLKAGYAFATEQLRLWYGPANGGVPDKPDGQWPTP